jgi:type III secretion system low calcium response chaperone LcrH/SycD
MFMTTDKFASTESAVSATTNMLLNSMISGDTLKEMQGVSDHVMEGVYAHAYEFYQLGRLDDAEVFFRFLSLYNQYNADYRFGLGATLQQKKQYQNAVDAYALAFSLSKEDYRPLLHTGQCYLLMKKAKEAHDCFNSILESHAADSIKAQARAYLAVMKPIDILKNNEVSHA